MAFQTIYPRRPARTGDWFRQLQFHALTGRDLKSLSQLVPRLSHCGGTALIVAGARVAVRENRFVPQNSTKLSTGVSLLFSTRCCGTPRNGVRPFCSL